MSVTKTMLSEPMSPKVVQRPHLTKFLPIAITIIAVDGILVGIPVVNYIFGLLALASYPVLIYTFDKGKVALLALLSLIITWPFSGISGIFSQAFSVTIPGIILGYAMLKRLSPWKAISYAFLPSLVIMMMFILNRAEIEASLYLAIETTISQIGAIPGIIAENGEMSAASKSYMKIMSTLMPSFILLSGIVNVALGYLGAQKALRRCDIEVSSLPQFIAWRPGFKLVWLFIAGLFLGVFQIEGSEYAGWNILVFTGIIYFVSGLAVVESFFLSTKMPFIFKLLFYMGIFFAQIFSLVVLAGVGLFDCWFNFRHRRIDKAV